MTSTQLACYSLDVEGPPKAHVLEAWSQPVVLLRNAGIFKKLCLVGGFRSLQVCYQRELQDPCLSLSLFPFLTTMR
jgi:hypothetical protein